MLSQRDKSVIVNILDEILGVGTSLKGNEQAHYCPFCHHHKKKILLHGIVICQDMCCNRGA